MNEQLNQIILAICPVCQGRGFVAQGFYQSCQTDTFVGTGGIETCRSCKGKGYVNIQEHQNLVKVVHNLYYSACWVPDRDVDADALWLAVRNAARFEPGHAPKPIPHRYNYNLTTNIKQKLSDGYLGDFDDKNPEVVRAFNEGYLYAQSIVEVELNRVGKIVIAYEEER